MTFLLLRSPAMKPLRCSVIQFFLFGMILPILAADPTSKTISIHQLPPAVQKTVKEELGDAKLVQIEKDEEDGEISYTVTRKVKEEDRDFVVAEDGTLL